MTPDDLVGGISAKVLQADIPAQDVAEMVKQDDRLIVDTLHQEAVVLKIADLDAGLLLYLVFQCKSPMIKRDTGSRPVRRSFTSSPVSKARIELNSCGAESTPSPWFGI